MRWVFALIVLAVLGFTVSWLLDPGTQAPPPIPGAAATGGDGAPADPASAAVASQGPDAAGAAADAPVREDGAPTGDAFGPTVHVQHADGAPAVEATVWFLDERDARRERGREATWTYWDTTEEQGRRTRTDARGDVTLPLARGRWLVAAHKDGEFGYLAVGRDGRHVLHLQTDEQVTIAATFPDGSPAAIPVAVRHQHRPGNADTIWRGQTDADGRAVVRHFQLLRRAVAAGQPETFAERFAAMACVPTSPVVVTEFAGRPTDERPVQLQVPALGRLQIRLQCHSGVPLLSSARVGFGAERRNRAPDAFPISRGLLHQSTEKPVGDEPTSLPFAPVGQPLRVYARFPSDRRAAYSEQSPGPSEGGGTAEITIRPLPQHTVLAGRLLVGRDRALAGARMAVTIWRDDQVHTTTNIGTIADGRWDAVLSGREDEARWRIEFRHDARNERGGPSGDEAPERWLGAIVDLPPWPPGTRVELGDVLLEPLPPLCAGVVVDDRGQPIAGATISIEQHRENAARETVIEGLNASNLRQLLNERSNGRRPRDGWRRLNGLRTSTDERGHFLLEARMPPGRLRVRADSDKHFAEYVELPEPNQNLQIALARNGVLSGRLLLPEWLPERSVTVVLQPVEQARRGADTRRETISLRRGGRFRVEPLRPGQYELLVQMRNLPAPMARIGGLFVQPSDNTDPRLDPLDLSGALHRYQLRALDAGGQPMALDGPIHARLQHADGSWSEAGFRWQNGRAELITPSQTAELTFFGRGFEPLKRQYGPGSHDVYLRTLQPALVEVPGARALCGPTRKVRISAILQGDTGYPSSLSGTDQQTGRRFSFPRWDLGRSSGGWLEQTDLVQIPLMKAGKYEIILRAHATESTRTPQASVTLGTFELTPGGLATTTVPVPAQQVTEALQRIDEQWRQQQERRRNRGR